MSAFLKLLSLNDRPQLREVRARLAPAGDAYDYHRSLRLRIRRHLTKGEPIDAVLESANAIKRESEKASVRMGLQRLRRWRALNLGPLVEYEPVTYESPSGIFKVTFTPDFGVQMGRHGVAIHVWNTATPPLRVRMVYAALALFREPYVETVKPPDDLAVLSLRDMNLYRLSEAGRLTALGLGMAVRIEDLFRELSYELGLPAPEQRPAPPFGAR